MAAGFRSNIFDPVLIIAQIVATQSFFYLSLGLWLAVADLTGGIQTSVDQIFDYHEFEGSYDGWLVMGAMIINSFTGALALWWVVRRGKQCLDFIVTVFLFHLVVCVCYGGLPRSWAWWITNLVSLAIMTILGEYLCMRSELAAIPLSSSTMGKS